LTVNDAPGTYGSWSSGPLYNIGLAYGYSQFSTTRNVALNTFASPSVAARGLPKPAIQRSSGPSPPIGRQRTGRHRMGTAGVHLAEQ
jgi:hypothetical protein